MAADPPAFRGPDPKPVTEGGIGRKKPDRGNRTRGRKMASPQEWDAIRAEKYARCRLLSKGFVHNLSADVELHHLVARARGGDDVADNIVSLCETCHKHVTENDAAHLSALAASLTDSEYAYVTGKLGENALGRLFGV